jgi:signal transduction histidine kinase
VILTDAETVIDHPEMPDAERLQSLLELRTEATRMAELCGSLLHLARGDSKAPVQLSTVDWDDVLRVATRDARLICAPRPVTVNANGGLGSGLTDQGSVLSVLRIIFDNVARHTPTTSRVVLEASGNPERVWVAVSDTGPGVRGDLVPRVFDRFFRADSARRGQGSGLGLAIARTAIERLGGTIDASNREAGGFHVKFELPRSRPA